MTSSLWIFMQVTREGAFCIVFFGSKNQISSTTIYKDSSSQCLQSLQIWAFFLKKKSMKSSHPKNKSKNPLSNQKWNKTLLQKQKKLKKSGGEQFENFFRYCSTTTIYYSTKNEKFNYFLSLLLYTFLIYLTPRWHCQKDGLFTSTVTARALPSLKKVLL